LRHNAPLMERCEDETGRHARRTRPPWWATLGAALFAALFFAAGSWQLNRAAEKRALLESFDRAAAAHPMPAPRDAEAIATLRYRPVRATGHFDASHQVLLDARIRDGRAGYEVLTPLLTGTGAILVNRGWVAASPDRSRLPEIGIDSGEVTIRGMLDALPQAALALEPDEGAQAAGWPRRLLYPTTQDISAALGYPVRNYQILLAPDAADGFRRDWRPVLLAPQQHLGYAVQWFALAATVVVIYAALGFRRTAPADRT